MTTWRKKVGYYVSSWRRQFYLWYLFFSGAAVAVCGSGLSFLPSYCDVSLVWLKIDKTARVPDLGTCGLNIADWIFVQFTVDFHLKFTTLAPRLSPELKHQYREHLCPLQENCCEGLNWRGKHEFLKWILTWALMDRLKWTWPQWPEFRRGARASEALGYFSVFSHFIDKVIGRWIDDEMNHHLQP